MRLPLLCEGHKGSAGELGLAGMGTAARGFGVRGAMVTPASKRREACKLPLGMALSG
jgi:hypothetical protein